jgi:RimJ/RimL family protein N-acetyltransferase
MTKTIEVFETRRLRFRPYVEKDRESYLMLVTDPDVMRHVEQGPPTPEIAKEWWQKILNRKYPGKRWCVESLSEPDFIGHAMINAYEESHELGYVLPKNQWGKGYATEIARALAAFSLDDMGLDHVLATVDIDHATSINVLEKTGFMFHRFDHDEKGTFSVYILRHQNDQTAGLKELIAPGNRYN